MPRALLIRGNDNVATVLQDIEEKEIVSFALGETKQKVQVKQNIPFGHKFAVTRIEKGESIVKYGEIIGRAICTIEVGYHVHVHNVESTRGREAEFDRNNY